MLVTRMGVGLAALGRPAYITVARPHELGPERDAATMARRTHAVLDAAFDAGVRYVDAARSYGRAEEFLASWLAARHVAAGDLVVGSKWGYRYTGAWRMDAPVHEEKEHTLAMFERQLDETAGLLGTHLSLYQVHSATLESGALDDTELLGALAALGHTGVAVGLTVSGPDQGEIVRRALDLEVEGANPFGVVQATWNLLEPSVGDALATAHDRGWGVIVKEVLANGRLSFAPTGSPATGTGDGGRGGAALAGAAARLDASVEQVATAVALAQPWADVVLSGAVRPEQLTAGLAALDLAVGGDELAALAPLAQPPEDYWQERSGLPWH